MITTARLSNLKQSIARTLTATILLFTGTTLTGWAQTTPAPAPPSALFQYASLTGSGNTINVTQVPVVVSPGVTLYFNLAIQFDVDGSGNLTISDGFPQITAAPAQLTSSFTPGQYVGPSTIYNGEMAINVSGPGVTDGGATVWSSSSAKGANSCTYPGTATWYVGPITSSPYAARLQSAGITSTAWSYGVSSPGGCYTNKWGGNTLIGVSQIGNTITFVSFTNNGQDYGLPVDQVTYTFLQ